MKRRVHTRAVFDIATGRVIEDEWVLHDGLWINASTMAAWDQDSYAFYEDGTESGSSIIGSANNQQTLDIDTNYQARLLIQETAGASGNLSTPEWEYNHNSGGWIDVTTTSSVVKAVDSANLTDTGDTTQRVGGGTFITTNGWISETGAMATLAFAGNDECEGLLSFQIIGADVAHGDEILLRMFNIDTYTRNADIDVNKPSGGRRVFVI